MALRAAAWLLALGSLAVEASAQGVGSWRNEPGTGAIVYDGRGGRLFWDANGQLVGRYNFHANRYEALPARPPGIGASLADNQREPPANLPRASQTANDRSATRIVKSPRWQR